MAVSHRGVAAALLAIGVAGAGAGAQQQPAQSGCHVDTQSPKELLTAGLRLNALTTGDTASRIKAAQSIVKAIGDKPDVARQNPAGYGYMLQQALTSYASATGRYTATRADLGFASNGAQQVDLLAAIDSADRMVEQAQPVCSVAIRASSPLWQSVANKALGALSAQQYDSARTYAQRSLVLYPGNPYAYHVLANAAIARNDTAGAVTAWKQVVQTGGTDTVYNQLVRLALLSTATDAPGADARPAMQAFMQRYPRDPNAQYVFSHYADHLLAQHDTADVLAALQMLQGAQTAPSDMVLAQAGVTAVKLHRTEDAMKLFDAARAQNPNSRDALFDLAATYNDLGRYQDMLPVLRQLEAVDPNNPDDAYLTAEAYQGLYKAAKDPKGKKSYADSLLAYKKKSDTMPIAVRMTSLNFGESKTSVTFSLENRTKAAKSVPFKVDFLDGKGAVVGTKEQTVGPIGPAGKQTVTLELPQTGVVAVRYSPVS